MTAVNAIIGTGSVPKKIAAAIKEAKKTKLVAALSREKERGASFAENVDIDKAY